MQIVADPNWVPLAVTPGHPEYHANHGCVTQAVMDALTAFFGTDEIPYPVTSAVTQTTHSFNSFEDVVTEVDNARIYGGMHYQHAVKQGNRLGRLVTEYMLSVTSNPATDEVPLRRAQVADGRRPVPAGASRPWLSTCFRRATK